MVDSAPSLDPSYNGGSILPSILRTSIQTAEAILQRRCVIQAGLLSRGSRGRVLNQSLPNPAWVAPEDLNRVFVPTKLVEDGLAHFRGQHAESGVPSEVLRDLLEEACSPSELQASANLRGCRLAATEVGGVILAAHPSGQVGELLCLSELARSREGLFQGKRQSHAQAVGSPILQLAWNQPKRSQDRLLLACRTSHWMCVYDASCTGGDENLGSLSGEGGMASAWTLKPVAAHQAAVRISHMAWNPQLPSLMGYVCEDGSVHMADAESQVGDARQISLAGGMFPRMQAHVVDATNREPVPHKHARLVCEWGLHPLTLLLAAGAHLLRYDIRKPGASCACRAIHTLPEGDAFVALAPKCHATSAPHDRQLQHLMAASTLHCILLLDLRRPQQALLKWPQGSRREPPQLLSMYCTAGPEEAHTDADTDPSLNPSHRRESPLESTLRGPAAVAEHNAQTVKCQPELLASQYGSSTQPPSSQELLSDIKLEHAPRRFGTQASQAASAELHRTPMPDALDPWPVSWHAEAPPSHEGGVVSHSPGSRSAAHKKSLHGRICAANMGYGDVLLYSFTCSTPEVEVHACPPAGSQPDAASTASQPAVGSIKVPPIPAAQHHLSQPGQLNRQQIQRSMSHTGPPGPEMGNHDSGDAAIQNPAGFTWRPAGMTATYAQGLSRRISWPLKAVERVDAGLEGLAPDLAQQLEEVHREGPDLCGMAVVPPAATSGNPGAALVRLGFLGHISAQTFADPVSLPNTQQAQPQAADAVYDIFSHSTAAMGPAAARHSKQAGRHRVWLGQRLRPVERTEADHLCSMSGHRAIAEAALQASRLDSSRAAEVSMQTRDALSSLLQDTEVPLSLWEIAQELGREGTEKSREDDFSMYRRRAGSILEGLPVIDYTTEGSRASRLRRWEKLRTDHERLAAVHFQQALSEATDGEGTLFGNPARLRGTVAAIAAAAGDVDAENKQALKLREGLTIPRQTSLADARDALQNHSALHNTQVLVNWAVCSAGVQQSFIATVLYKKRTSNQVITSITGVIVHAPLPSSQITSLTATPSQASPLVQQSTARLAVLDRSYGAGDIVYPISQDRPQDAADVECRPARMTLHIKIPEIADEAARKALEDLEKDWIDFDRQLSGRTDNKAPAQPPFWEIQTPGQTDRGAEPRRASATEQSSGLRKAKRPGAPLTSRGKARKGATGSRPPRAFEEGFS